MNLNGVAQDLTSRLNSDEQFRRLFHSDPGAALREAGLGVSAGEERRIRNDLAAASKGHGFIIPGVPIPPICPT